MAYYDAMIAKWPTLAPGTTTQKLAEINAANTTGQAIPMIVPTYKIYNLISLNEFTALTDPNQQLVRDILGMGTVDCSPGTFIRSRIIAMFPNGTATFTSLASFANGFDKPVVNWCKENGYPMAQSGGIGGLTQTDATAAGLA